jgi:hypothetical protein
MNTEVYGELDIDGVRSCCPLGVCKEIPVLYPRYLAERNCRLTNRWAPPVEVGIQILYIGESPPKSEKFVYDSNSPLGWFSGKIQEDLRDEMGVDDFRRVIDKPDFLVKIQKNGVLAIDCCKCAIDYETLGKTLRNDIACLCCRNHTNNTLAGICRKYDPQIRFAFPRKRGEPILRHFKGKYGNRVVDIR